ncbi:MAG: C25 family cysteine peptidase [Calditrichota bacterium]
MLLPCAVLAAQISIPLEYPSPLTKDAGEYQRVYIKDGLNLGAPGEPALPTVDVWALLPPRERAAEIQLKNQQWQALSGRYKVAPNDPPRKLSDNSPYTPAPPDPRIYENNAFWPPQGTSFLQTHLKRGYSVATCLICPVRWNPVSGVMEYLSQAELIIQTEPGERERLGYEQFYRGDAATRASFESRIANRGGWGWYPPRDDGEPEGILVVSGDAYLNAAQGYAAWRSPRGTPVWVVSVDDISAGRNGRDPAERIRSGIIEAYQEWGIGSVLLLGDTDDIPHRGMYGVVNQDPDDDVPADLYYASFDGNWDEDGNGIWGEVDEYDLLAEIAVGRLACDNANQAETALRKVSRYSDLPPVEETLNVLMIGEELGWDVEGGAYMDEIYDGSAGMGHRTAGFPERFQRRNLYDRDNVWDARQDLAPLIANGSHFINHMGHANTRSVLKFDFGQISDNILTNNGVNHILNVVYTQGCYCGAFDDRDPDRNYPGDCISEKFTAHLANSFAALFSNSRYGWGNGGSTDGASQQFHREFIDAIFSENITTAGKANEDSKEDLAAWGQNDVMLWCYYEVNLFGDPLLDFWTDTPQELEPEFSGALVIGDPIYPVDVGDLAGAAVCISQNNRILSVAVSDQEGVAALEFPQPLEEPGAVLLTVTAHNYLPFTAQVEAIRPDRGYPWVESLRVLDGEGNNDGQADPGETFDLAPRIHNLGNESLQELTVTISTEDQLLRIIQPVALYPLIQAAGEEAPQQNARVAVDLLSEDLHEVPITLQLADNQDRRWSQQVILTLHAPVISDYRLELAAGAGLRLQPDQETELTLFLTNTGSGQAGRMQISLECDNAEVEVLEAQSQIASIAPLSEARIADPFRVRVSADCPNPFRSAFYLRLEGERGFQRNIIRELDIGGMVETLEGDRPGWNHQALGGAGDQWHFCDNDNYTPGGAHCIKAGNVAPGGNYNRFLDCVMELPPIALTGPARLVFYHKMEAENNRNVDTLAFDGGFVEIRTGEGGWETIEPWRNGRYRYPYTIMHGNSRNPLSEGQGVFSGLFNWERAVFDLTGYEGEEVSLRFHFGADSSTQRDGWWIDDIDIQYAGQLDSPDFLEGRMQPRGAFLTWVSPYRRDDNLETLLGYRIYRGVELLDTLVAYHQYFDNLIGRRRGTMDYMVTAQYSTGESQPSNMISLFWWASAPEEIIPPLDWGLEPAFPNPFNSRAVINYSVPAAGSVKLSLIDVNGREIAVILNQHQAAGKYQAILDGAKLASGVYLVRMETPDVSRMERLVLIR